MSTPQALIDQWRLHPDPEVGSCANQLAGWRREALQIIERELAALDRVSFVVDLQHVTSKKHCGGLAVVVDRSDAMHALLFVREAIRAASRGGGDTP